MDVTKTETLSEKHLEKFVLNLVVFSYNTVLGSSNSRPNSFLLMGLNA